MESIIFVYPILFPLQFLATFDDAIGMLRRLNNADAFAHLVSALEVMKEASSAIKVLLLSPTIASILSIVKTVETFKKDKQRCIRLAKRAFELAERVNDTMRAESNAIDDKLSIELRKLHNIVAHIQTDLDKWANYKTWVLFLRRGTLSDMLDEHFDAIDGAWRSFMAVAVCAPQRKLNAQVIYDSENQVGVSDCILRNGLKLNGRVRKQVVAKGTDETPHDEWEGEYNGSDVIIQKYADEDSYKQSLSRLLPAPANM
ncbi:hypothetical protein CERSUDRAFT_97101 [Gelatoporia subvermispora B]|uniref:Uncharacterized protein n=1 Tax=Ceriporiopsis subvermispora (strain B) TaxID=914234 RepID=M2QDQ6_CERS8|nr:hypothetical protein CERSUDRAFT_97101 [Gelatoporia subvermispora B]